jgi:thiamine pyrophosphokinase
MVVQINCTIDLKECQYHFVKGFVKKIKIIKNDYINYYFYFYFFPPFYFRYIPDYIRGDLDSLREDVRHFFYSQETEIQQESEQKSTDFMKCIKLISIKEEEEENSSKYDVLAIGAFGGRFDQTMSNIHYLYKLKDERKIYLLSDNNMTFLLDKVRKKKYIYIYI